DEEDNQLLDLKRTIESRCSTQIGDFSQDDSLGPDAFADSLHLHPVRGVRQFSATLGRWFARQQTAAETTATIAASLPSAGAGFPELLRMRAESQGSQVAFLEMASHRSWSYAELFDLAQRFRTWLERREVPKGAVLGFVESSNPLLFPLLAACSTLRIKVATLHPDLTLTELRALIEHSGAVFVFASASLGEILAKSYKVVTFEQLESQLQQLEPTPLGAQDDKGGLIVYTSGSSGTPKGVLLGFD